MPTAEETLRSAYRAFNARDIEAAVALMHPEVDWPNAWEGGRVVGHAAVSDYWTRQFAAISSRVEPLSFTIDVASFVEAPLSSPVVMKTDPSAPTAALV